MLNYGCLEDACGELVRILTKKLAEYHQLELEGWNMSSLIRETQKNLDDVLGLLKKEEEGGRERMEGV